MKQENSYLTSLAISDGDIENVTTLIKKNSKSNDITLSVGLSLVSIIIKEKSTIYNILQLASNILLKNIIKIVAFTASDIKISFIVEYSKKYRLPRPSQSLLEPSLCQTHI